MPQRKLTINDPKIGSFQMDWSGQNDPTDDDIDDFIRRNALDKKIENPVKAAPKGNTLWEKANRPMLPDVKMPGTLEAGPTLRDVEYRTQHPIRSFAEDALKEIASETYKNIIQPITSPLGGVITAATAALGIPEVKPYVKPVVTAGLGLLSGKQAVDTVPRIKEAWQRPTVDNVADAALGTFGTLATGAGAVQASRLKTGRGPSRLNVTPPELPLENPVQRPELVVPKGVKIQVRPGYEDVLGEDAANQRVIVRDPSKFKEAVSSISGPDKEVKQLAKDVKANTPSVDYNEGYNPDALVDSYVKGPKDTKQSFADWVNGRAAAKFTGENARKVWSKLDETYKPQVDTNPDTGEVTQQAKHPLVQLQEAILNKQEPELERYFNQLHEEVKKAGVQDRQLRLGYNEDYLPQMWKNSPEEVNEAFKETRRLGTKPSFSMKKIFADYQTGIDRGLEPAFEKPSDLIASYADYVDKFVADKNFFDQLRVNGQLKTREQLGNDWKDYEALDPKRTPVQRFVENEQGKKGQDITTINRTREYYVPKDLASSINNYLQGGEKDTALGKAARAFGHVKSLVMTSGIPGTGLNIHGINIGVGRMWQAQGAKMVGQYLKYAVKPQEAVNFTQANLHDAPRFVRAGLKFNPEDVFSQNESSPLASSGQVSQGMSKVVDLKHHLLEKPLFGQIIPALQLELAQNFEKGYLERKIDPELATRLAAHDANTFVSNINHDELMRHKDIRNLLSVVSFAPTWLESHTNIAKGVSSALLNPKDPKGYLYRQAVGQVLKAYIVVGTINKLTTGKFDPLELHLGKSSDGKEISLPLMGGADDWIKIPLEIAQSVANGNTGSRIADLTRGRLASPLQFATDFLAKQKAQGGNLFTDFKGNQLSLGKQAKNVGELGLKTMAPRWVVSVPGSMTGDNSLPQAVGDVMGAQLRFRSQPKVRAPF